MLVGNNNTMILKWKESGRDTMKRIAVARGWYADHHRPAENKRDSHARLEASLNRLT
jgi:hypothetical protein